MVSEHALEDVLSWGIKIDAVLHQHLSLNDLDALVENQFPIEVVTIRDNDVTEKAMEFLAEHRCHTVNIVTHHAEKFIRKIDKIRNSIHVGVYSEGEKWSLISNRTFEKWMPAGSFFLSWHTPGLALHTTGVVKINDRWEVQESGMVKFYAEDPFWIGEPSLPMG
jgi:hypothetical protein